MKTTKKTYHAQEIEKGSKVINQGSEDVPKNTKNQKRNAFKKDKKCEPHAVVSIVIKQLKMEKIFSKKFETYSI